MITNEMIIERGAIGEWTPYEDPMVGTIEFHSPNHPNVILATPNWIEDNMLPIDYLDENEEYHQVAIVPLDGDTQTQMDTYIQVIQNLIKTF